MANPWIVHVKAYAKKHNLKYIDALKSGDCKKQYGAKNGGGDGPYGSVESVGQAQDVQVQDVQAPVGQTPALNGGMADFKPQTGGKKSAKKSRKSRKTRKARKSKK